MAAHTIDTDGLTTEQIDQIATEGQARGLRLHTQYDGALIASNALARDWAESIVKDLREGATAPVSAQWTRLATGAWGAALDAELRVGSTVVIENQRGQRTAVTLVEFVEPRFQPYAGRTVYVYTVTPKEN